MSEASKPVVCPRPIKNLLRSVLPERTGILAELESFAKENHVPIIDPEGAQVLRMLTAMHRPTRVLEIGAAIGYSAFVLSEYMIAGGHIDTIERNPRRAELARENLKRMEKVTVQLHEGTAEEVLLTLDGTYDFIFIDAAKGQYQKFFDLAEPKLRNGGMIVSDNVLFKGYIAEPSKVRRRDRTIVRRMQAYLENLSNNPRFETSIIPIGDGMAISQCTGGKK